VASAACHRKAEEKSSWLVAFLHGSGGGGDDDGMRVQGLEQQAYLLFALRRKGLDYFDAMTTSYVETYRESRESGMGRCERNLELAYAFHLHGGWSKTRSICKLQATSSGKICTTDNCETQV
jgi:hypothetical protein